MGCPTLDTLIGILDILYTICTINSKTAGHKSEHFKLVCKSYLKSYLSLKLGQLDNMLCLNMLVVVFTE